jgi:glutathione S-transferase
MPPRKLVIYGYETSNNIKVLLALSYKGIAHEFHKIDPAVRDEIVRISGQFLTPVMVHGETVLFDSASILRYLDANFPETPKLYGRERQEQWEIEDWERFGRTALAEPMMTVVHGGASVSPAMRAEAEAAFATAAHKLEARLAGRQWLVGVALTAADITCGAVIYRIRSSGMLPWPAGCPRAEDLAARVMALRR